jgi:hypothetical protein
MTEEDNHDLKILKDEEDILNSESSARSHLKAANQDSDSNKIYKFTLQFWFLSFIILVIGIICVMIGSLSTPRWAIQGKGQFRWRAGILKCGGCQGKWEGLYFSKILKEAKDYDIKGWENTIERLYQGGVAFVVLESFALSFCVIWTILICFILKGRKIWKDCLVYFIVIFTILLHSAALAAWFGATEAKFGDCEDVAGSNDDDFDICASHGPAIAIAIEIALFVGGVGFMIIFKNRRSSSVGSASRLEVNNDN